MPIKTVKENNLDYWLSYISSVHLNEIELGLERVQVVYSRMNLKKLAKKVVVVAGTNGKGSCVAAMESILLESGCTVASYTSPHIKNFSERIKLCGIEVEEGELCRSFKVVDVARSEIPLSYFEFATLAAFYIFSQRELDFAVLEVGLGGRLDAVNIIDADVTVISSIAMDHEDWLGNDLESIAIEKLGILRKGVPLIYGDDNPLEVVLEKSEKLKVPLFLAGREVTWEENAKPLDWKWAGTFDGKKVEINNLQTPNLAIANVSLAIQALFTLGLEFDHNIVNSALNTFILPGRYEKRTDKRTGISVILDVAHNPASANLLMSNLAKENLEGNNLIQISAVIAVMADKDIGGIIMALEPSVDGWYVSQFEGLRCKAAADLACEIQKKSSQKIENIDDSMAASYVQACSDAAAYEVANPDNGAIVLVTGSFQSVAAVRDLSIKR
ncbi:MAG: Mur ligase family protein [Gammaproteobacteria bacterium]|nr:Mur ligase family protein [Gammaproteobacteria bacterium]